MRRDASVSLLMIVRNEERNLAECLTPVASLFDEIVIVDTGSQDQTRRIASRFTPHVSQFAWCDDFSAARNASLERSRGDWIFWLDADDRVREDNVVKLRALFDGLNDQPLAYLMNTVSPSRYECDGVWLVTHPRLFRRHPDLRWHGRVHEQLRPALSTLGYQTVWSDIQIEHLGYQDHAAWQRKLHRDIRLLRMDYAVDPDDTSTLLHLGLAYARTGNSGEAKKYLLRLADGANDQAEHLRSVYGVLGELSLREGMFEEAIQLAGRGLLLFAEDEYLLYLQAQGLYELERYESARATLASIINAAPSPRLYGSVPGDIQRKLAPRKLGDVLRMLGAYAEAEATLQALVHEFPGDTHSWYMLGLVYLDTNDRQKMEAAAVALRSCPQGDVFASLLAAMWHLRHNDLAPAGMLIEKLIGDAPQMSLPRLLRAEWLSRSRGPLESQIQALLDVLRVQPGNADAQRELKRLEGIRRSVSGTTANDGCTSVILGAGMPVVARSR